MKKENLKNSRQYRKLLDNNRAFLGVPMTWCVRFDLTPTELLILRHIQYMSQQSQGIFTGSMKGLCVICNSSLPTVRKACLSLNNRGFIRKIFKMQKLESGRNVDWVCYQSTIPYNTPPNDKNIEQLIESELMARKVIEYNIPIKGKMRY